VGGAQVRVCGAVCAAIGGRRASMMGCDVEAPCEGCEFFEVVERSTASLNSFTCFGEVVPGSLGGGGVFLTVSVEPMLICMPPFNAACVLAPSVVDCRAKRCDGRHSSQRHVDHAGL